MIGPIQYRWAAPLPRQLRGLIGLPVALVMFVGAVVRAVGTSVERTCLRILCRIQ
jgi:hypothetical protein